MVRLGGLSVKCSPRVVCSCSSLPEGWKWLLRTRLVPLGIFTASPMGRCRAWRPTAQPPRPEVLTPRPPRRLRPPRLKPKLSRWALLLRVVRNRVWCRTVRALGLTAMAVTHLSSGRFNGTTKSR